MTRTKRSTLIFSHSFKIEGVGRSFPAGSYEQVTDEELIEGLSFPAYRRVSTWIITPTLNSSNSTEMIVVDPVELAGAHARDVACTNQSNGEMARPSTSNME
jgi:hypothetical protein